METRDVSIDLKKCTCNCVQQNVSNCVYILIKIDKYVFRIAGNQ